MLIRVAVDVGCPEDKPATVSSLVGTTIRYNHAACTEGGSRVYSNFSLEGIISVEIDVRIETVLSWLVLNSNTYSLVE